MNTFHFCVQAYSIVALAEDAKAEVKQRVEELLEQFGCTKVEQLLDKHPEARSSLAGMLQVTQVRVHAHTQCTKSRSSLLVLPTRGNGLKYMFQAGHSALMVKHT